MVGRKMKWIKGTFGNVVPWGWTDFENCNYNLLMGKRWNYPCCPLASDQSNAWKLRRREKSPCLAHVRLAGAFLASHEPCVICQGWASLIE